MHYKNDSAHEFSYHAHPALPPVSLQNPSFAFPSLRFPASSSMSDYPDFSNTEWVTAQELLASKALTLNLGNFSPST
jgi:hypothetical protein